MKKAAYSFYLIFISAAFAMGCSSSHSDVVDKSETCSAATKQGFLDYEQAKAANDSVLVSNSCARILSVSGAQSCQMKDSAGQFTVVSYHQIEKDCETATALVEQATLGSYEATTR